MYASKYVRMLDTLPEASEARKPTRDVLVQFTNDTAGNAQHQQKDARHRPVCSAKADEREYLLF
jgi:exopolysaccharide biosynthesis predicted pyruvyltransferase EpsI